MSRVEAAIQEGRCVLAIGGRALQDQEVLAELRRRAVPAVALGADPINPVVAISEDALAAVTNFEGSLLVIVEPDSTMDGKALNALSDLIAKGKHKPRVAVAAKSFNPFGLPLALRLMKLEQIKQRARDFLASLPVSAAPVVVVAAAPAAVEAARVDEKSGGRQAPRPVFVGREEELPALVELLKTDGGPIVVSGAPGVGRRWLVEQAIASAGLKRLPDFTFARGIGADSLLGRIAAMAQDAGDDALANALRSPGTRPMPTDLAQMAAKALQNPAMAGSVWVCNELHRELDRRDGSLHRMGRLELTLREILISEPSLRVIFVSNQAPTFYKEGEAASLRKFPVVGLKGRDLHLLFKAWHVEEVQRDRMGPVYERTHGHPLLTRAFAIEVAEGGDLDELLKSPRHLKAENIQDLEPLRRHLKRKIDDLDPDTRKALAAAAHLREPGTANELQGLGVTRNDRINLLGRGLLEQTPHADDRRFYVHPLVREHLEFQETSRFDTMEMLGDYFNGLSRNRDKTRAERLTWAQEASRLYIEGRRRGGDRDVLAPYPNNDALAESVAGLMRRKEPRLDMARARINEGLKADPKHTELMILDAELVALEKGSPDAVAAAWARPAEQAPTPEVFHQEASYYLDKNARGKAVTALERGVALFPLDARLHRRLANLYLRQNRNDDAVTTLRRAMELEPMMPDAYSVLGEIYTGRGPAHWEEAGQFIEEALRLNPDDPGHIMRQANLLRYRGMVDLENRAALWGEAIEKLKIAVANDPNGARIHALLGALIVDSEGDLDQAEWLVKRALKLSENSETLVQRARVLIRRAAFAEAEQLLDKAVKKEPSYHQAFGALGELMLAQGQIFIAFEHFKKARERSPREAAERALYEVDLARLGTIIESGAAAEMMKAAEIEVQVGGSAPSAEGSDGPRRDAGQTTRLRKRRRGRRGGSGEEASAEGSEEGSAAQLEGNDEITAEAGNPSTEEIPDGPAQTEITEDAPPVEIIEDEPAEIEPAPAEGDDLA